MSRHRIANTAGLALATLLCWLYGLHLYRAANAPLYSPAPPPAPHARPEPQAAGLAPDLRIGDSSDRVLTFVHATDVHVSKYVAWGGLAHFQHFLRTAVPLIAPRLVLVTGDLTDGKDRQKLVSQQQPDEWRAYRRALDESGVLQRFNGTFYRDQRGNHDCFNVFAADARTNYYATHSASRDSSGYALRLDEPYGAYAFVASDGCPRHGFARPLNFFGYLDARDMRALEQRLDGARGANHTFWLNHYPASTMVYGRHRRAFAELARQVSVVLCGHLHQLAGGLGAQLQAYRERLGFWELELGDMKEHAVYRVYAVDHDLVSFVDVTLPLPAVPLPNPRLLDARADAPLPHPPVVLVTNPKDARYLLPAHEPLHRMRHSAFIRALVWTDQPVARVDITIDGLPHPHAAVFRGGERAIPPGSNDTVKTPLWVAPWDPARYDDGRVHQLHVSVVDAAGKRGAATVPFSFARQPLPLHNGARGGWIMRQDFAALFRVSGLGSYVLMVLLLLVAPRVHFAVLPNFEAWIAARLMLHHKDQAELRHLWASRARSPGGAVARAKLLLAMLAARARFLVWTQYTAQVYFASVPWLFWPAYLFAMGLSVLPLFTGRLIPSAPGSDGVGSVYTYGIYIAGEWAPLLDSYTYALASIISLAVLLLYLPVAVTPPKLFCAPRGRARRPWYRSVAVRVCMLVFVLVYLGVPVLTSVYTYGWLTVALGYGKAWLFVAALLALYAVDWRYPVPLSSEYSRVPSPASSASETSD
ncbi:hypothetical protein H4S01_003273 [Coemansia sp. RSA 2610]|nr:hypothetical protein H4S01_003273 [Coemansia sp. RSA 2610]